MKAATRVRKQNQFGKIGKIGNKGQFRKLKSKVETPVEMPATVNESNERGDKICTALFLGILALSFSILGGGGYWSISSIMHSLQASPVSWSEFAIATITLLVSLLLVRALIWLSFFASMSLAMRMGAWNALESTSKKALRLPRILSRGTAWSSLFLVQSLVSRGEYQAAAIAAEEEWARSGDDEKQAQSMGPMATTIGMTSQALGDLKESLKWNDRGISALNKCMDFMNKPKKNILERAAASQAGNWMGQLKAQLATAHFSNGTIYFNKMDYRRAKENYRKAVEYAKQSSDFPQKDYLLQVGKEQLHRLKHQ